MEPTTPLRALFGRRAWAELLYSVVALVFAAAGAAYLVATLALGAGLAITAVGIPLLACGVYGARRLGRWHLRLAGGLLGEDTTGPGPVRFGPGPYGRVQSMLSDTAGWRALAYLLLQVPVALLQAYVVVFTWAWGLVALTYPVQFVLGWNQTTTRDAGGRIRHGAVILGLHIDTVPRTLLLSAAGLALLLVAPWAVHAATMPTRLLVRWLLGPHTTTERIRDLRETRAQAVEDAAATLRRIERDLHDGAQARLVALTMQLTLVKEAVPDGPARELATAAQATAKEAIAELRELVRGIHPPILDKGLDAALASLAARSPVPVELRAGPAPSSRPSPAIESIAYFCAAELLTNVARHSGASTATLDLTYDGDRLRLRVSDDGRGGARPAAPPGQGRAGAGSGLAGLLERVRTVDGRLEIDSPGGGPTAVIVTLPTHA